MITASGEHYEPCAFGVHVCGVSQDENEPVTVANFPTRNSALAHALFAAARAQFQAGPDEPADLIVDLCEGPHDMTDTFPMTRQMLDRLRVFALQESRNADR